MYPSQIEVGGLMGQVVGFLVC